MEFLNDLKVALGVAETQCFVGTPFRLNLFNMTPSVKSMFH